MAVITIPQLSRDGSIWDGYPVVGKPGWYRSIDQDGKTVKQLIRCNCGSVSRIGLHHVHPDGTVTNSFYHKKGDRLPGRPELVRVARIPKAGRLVRRRPSA